MQRYEFKVISENRDTYPNNFKCWVWVTDRKTHTLFKRRGYGKFIGNFSPIWITIEGKSQQLTQWEREEYDAYEDDSVHGKTANV